MSIDSIEQHAGSSNARPVQGASVSRSCCWHHTVRRPFWRICVFKMHATPFANAAFAAPRVSSGIGMSNGGFAS